MPETILVAAASGFSADDAVMQIFLLLLLLGVGEPWVAVAFALALFR